MLFRKNTAHPRANQPNQSGLQPVIQCMRHATGDRGRDKRDRHTSNRARGEARELFGGAQLAEWDMERERERGGGAIRNHWGVEKRGGFFAKEEGKIVERLTVFLASFSGAFIGTQAHLRVLILHHQKALGTAAIPGMHMGEPCAAIGCAPLPRLASTRHFARCCLVNPGPLCFSRDFFLLSDHYNSLL